MTSLDLLLCIPLKHAIKEELFMEMQLIFLSGDMTETLTMAQASTCAFTITPERIGIGTVNPIYDLQIGF